MSNASGKPLWVPSGQRREQANMTRFMGWVRERHDVDVSDYLALWRWSVDELEDFWASVWEFCSVAASVPYARVLGSRTMAGAQWFEGARGNYAENVLLRHDDERVAVLHASESQPLAQISGARLRERVTRVAGGLADLGVGRGDRVVSYMPNVPETLIAFLASASLGAIWSSAAPEFGARSVIERFAQIEPKVLLAADGYRYGGRDFDRLEALHQILDELPTVTHTVVLTHVGPDHERRERAGRDRGLRGALSWSELEQRGTDRELQFEQLPFDHPLWVLYSSGTTGLPKAIVQGHGGILLEHLKLAHLHLDLHAEDRMFWFTTTGWMMWNLLVGCLLTDAAIVLYDGSPAHPDGGVLWDLARDARITCLGTSAGFLMNSLKQDVHPARGRDLSALRSVGSTGSPLAPEAFRWVYDELDADTWLFSTSGGSDVCTAFVGGCPLLPVYEGELQCRALGCAVEAFDEQGRALIDEVGELVITEPMPSMPLFFWGDPDGSRYRESYFDMYPGVWRHGDWIRFTPHGGAVIYGRSDATINRGGVRMGTSEIYRAAMALDDVLDALVVDVPVADGQSWMPLFVVLADGVALTPALEAEIRQRIREDCSPRHVPTEVLQIDEVPRTLSGKALELPVKRILMGARPERAASVDSLANPGALAFFVGLRPQR
jgi:acetoacetyl-CoA synthetase